MVMGEIDRWMSTEDVARETGMSPDWVRRQIAAGRLKANIWRVGKRPTIRIRRKDFDTFRSGFSVDSDDANL